MTERKDVQILNTKKRTSATETTILDERVIKRKSTSLAKGFGINFTKSTTEFFAEPCNNSKVNK